MYKVIQEADRFEIRQSLGHIVINQLITWGMLYYFGRELMNNFGSNNYFWTVVDGLVILFILRGFFTQLNQLLKNKPQLRIDAEGIYAQLDGFIPKADITRITLTDVGAPRQRLFIFVKNPDGYLSRSSGLKKVLAERLYKDAGTPFIIRLKGTFDREKLNELIEKLFPI